MDWRIVAGGTVAGVGAVLGWFEFGTLVGVLLSVGFVSALFLADWLIDRYVYGL